MGFEVQVVKKQGCHSFNTIVFLEIYLYGYLNGLRISRKLKKELFSEHRDGLAAERSCSNYHNISDFRKGHPSTLKKPFKVFVSFLTDSDLIADETIAIDGIEVTRYFPTICV